VTLQNGDRVRLRCVGDVGLPVVRYGFIEVVGGATEPVRVIFDGELVAEDVDGVDLDIVAVDTVDLVLDGDDLFHEPVLRPGLLAMWQAEAATAGIALDAVHPFGRPAGTGLRDAGESWLLAEVMAGGASYMVRAVVDPNSPGRVRVCADRPNRWEA
jgi:hypothetical protein